MSRTKPTLLDRPSTIELRHLRYFVAVAEELNFRRASERVHIDQSPLSRAVRELEDELGVLLLARTPRTMRLTPAGEVLLEEVFDLFTHWRRAMRRTRETDASYRAPLRVGIADELAQPNLSRCLVRWHETAPQTPLELVDLSARELAEALRREELDVGISFGVRFEDAIVQEAAWAYPLVAVLPAGHELASRKSLGLDEVVAYPMIACHPDHKPGKRRQLDAIVQRCKSSPIHSREAHSLTGLLNLVGARLGVGLVDAGSVETLCREDIVMVPLEDDLFPVTTYVLHKRRRSSLPEALQRFLALAKSSE